MKSRIRTHKKSRREQTSDFSTAPAQPMFQSRPFEVPRQQARKSDGKEPKKAMHRAKQYGHNVAGKVSSAQPAPAVGQRVVQRMELYDKSEKKSYHLDKKGQLTQLDEKKSDEKLELEKKVAEKVKEKLIKEKKVEPGPYVGVTVTNGVMYISCNNKWNENETDQGRKYLSKKATEDDVKKAGKEVIEEYQEEVENIRQKPEEKRTEKEKALMWLGKAKENEVQAHAPFTEEEMRTHLRRRNELHGEIRTKDQLEKEEGDRSYGQYRESINKKIEERLQGEKNQEAREKALKMDKVIRHGGTMRPCIKCHTEHHGNEGPRKATKNQIRYKTKDSHRGGPVEGWRDTKGGIGEYASREKRDKAVGGSGRTIDQMFSGGNQKAKVHGRTESMEANVSEAQRRRLEGTGEEPAGGTGGEESKVGDVKGKARGEKGEAPDVLDQMDVDQEDEFGDFEFNDEDFDEMTRKAMEESRKG